MLRTLTLATALLAALPARGEEIVLWHSYRAGEAEALDTTVDAFRAAHPEHSVRVLAVPAGPYAQKLKSAIPAGNGPDLFISAHDEVGDYVARELIDLMPATDAARFLEPTLSPLARREGGFW